MVGISFMSMESTLPCMGCTCVLSLCTSMSLGCLAPSSVRCVIQVIMPHKSKCTSVTPCARHVAGGGAQGWEGKAQAGHDPPRAGAFVCSVAHSPFGPVSLGASGGMPTAHFISHAGRHNGSLSITTRSILMPPPSLRSAL